MATRRRPGEPAKHGTNSGYNSGCHCDKCRKAHAEYNARYRKPKNRTGNTVPRTTVRTPPKPAPAPVYSGAAEEDFELSAQPKGPSLGDRLSDSIKGLVFPQDSGSEYVNTDEIPDYIHAGGVDPDPEPGSYGDDEEWSKIGDEEEFIVTEKMRKSIADNMATYLSVAGMTVEMIDPYCGPVLANNLDNIVDRWSGVVAHYPRAAKFFLAKQGGTLFAWMGAIQSTWPVLFAIYEHHLAKTVKVDNGVVLRATKNMNGHSQEGFDSATPPMPGYDYRID